ncbi:hypothetical protein TELCIR_16585 [Teladorsagia circumcincta]|uniref:Nematode cuticle collagen N-terminal domain-containing protein n=1 Tax=Teladorsagia circumcincta TaxID=45464 RepID=A0A2G9TVB8_TELCI|nr:hypothetical protein TELCIR_16585 [Teladorsagia circumcincta]
MDFKHRIKAYRVVAYSTVAFSVVAVLSVSVTLPILHSYVHNVRRTMRSELSHCAESAKDIWSEEPLDQLELPVSLVAQGSPEHPVFPETQDALHSSHATL